MGAGEAAAQTAIAALIITIQASLAASVVSLNISKAELAVEIEAVKTSNEENIANAKTLALDTSDPNFPAGKLTNADIISTLDNNSTNFSELSNIVDSNLTESYDKLIEIYSQLNSSLIQLIATGSASAAFSVN